MDHVEDTDSFPVHRVPHASTRRPVLLVLEGHRPERVHVLAEGGTTLGRDPACEIALVDSTASRRHARIELAHEDGGPVATVADLGSTNGTMVNGERLTGPRVLHEHDKLRIGGTLFAYLLRDDLELEADRRLVRLATTDDLTGLLNRGAFDRELAREFERARRYERPLALMLFDLDHFKRVNDTYGHPIGDQVLRAVGKVVLSTVRACDLSGRYGGEEFAVAYAETTLEGAAAAAERIRKALSRTTFRTDRGEFGVTISAGVGGLTPNVTLNDLVRRTDAALYEAKQAGRDRIVVVK